MFSICRKKELYDLFVSNYHSRLKISSIGSLVISEICSTGIPAVFIAFAEISKAERCSSNCADCSAILWSRLIIAVSRVSMAEKYSSSTSPSSLSGLHAEALALEDKLSNQDYLTTTFLPSTM